MGRTSNQSVFLFLPMRPPSKKFMTTLVYPHKLLVAKKTLRPARRYICSTSFSFSSCTECHSCQGRVQPLVHCAGAKLGAAHDQMRTQPAQITRAHLVDELAGVCCNLSLQRTISVAQVDRAADVAIDVLVRLTIEHGVRQRVLHVHDLHKEVRLRETEERVDRRKIIRVERLALRAGGVRRLPRSGVEARKAVVRDLDVHARAARCAGHCVGLGRVLDHVASMQHQAQLVHVTLWPRRQCMDTASSRTCTHVAVCDGTGSLLPARRCALRPCGDSRRKFGAAHLWRSTLMTLPRRLSIVSPRIMYCQSNARSRSSSG
jgi:hypothetical protein